MADEARELTNRELVEAYIRAANDVEDGCRFMAQHRARIVQLLAANGALHDYGSVLLMMGSEPSVVRTRSTYKLDDDAAAAAIVQETGEAKVA